MVPAIQDPGSKNVVGTGPSILRAGRISSSTGSLREPAARTAGGTTQGRAGSPSLTDKAPELELKSGDWATVPGGDFCLDTSGAMAPRGSGRGEPVLAWQAFTGTEALKPQFGSSNSSAHGGVSRPGSRPGSRPSSRGGTRSRNGGSDAFACSDLFRDCDREQMSFLMQNGRTRFVEAGEILIESGRGDTDVYILRRGEADVEVGGCVVFQFTGQTVFGEMKLLGSASAAALPVVIRAKTLCECRIITHSVLLHARRAFPHEQHLLVKLKQSQQQLELKIERAARNAETRHAVSSQPTASAAHSKDSNSFCPPSGGLTRSESLPSVTANPLSSLSGPAQPPPASGDPICGEAESANSLGSTMGVTSRAYSPGRSPSPSRSPSPEPTPLSEELRQRRLLVLRDYPVSTAPLTAICLSEAASLSGASQKSSPHPHSESSASLMSLEPPFSSKGPPTRMPSGTSLGSSLEWLVMPQQAGVSLPSGILPSSSTATNASSSVQASRPGTPADGNPLARPTNNTRVPVADGLPGTEPGDGEELQCFDDCDELPRLVRGASRGTSRASTPADVRRYPKRSDTSPADRKISDSMHRPSLSSGQATPPLLAPGLAASDFASTKSRFYEAARELVLPTRRCAREPQARPARLAECGRKLLAR